MRCRKVRSFLSAYCNDELSGRHRVAVSEHLSTCSSCRREESIYRSMVTARPELAQIQVSAEFESRLFDRIARERFNETRTKAYFPKPIPLISWGRVVPVVASACLAVALFIVTMSPQVQDGGNPMMSDGGSNLDDSYLTAQPVNNPNLASKLTPEWSLARQFAMGERITQHTNAVTRGRYRGFDQPQIIPASSSNKRMAPYDRSYYRLRPVVKVYVAPESSTDKGGSKVY